MLNTFDENLVITAVQQLATDLTSLSGRIKKLEDEGGGGWNLVSEKTYENVTISANVVPYDTINLPQGFLLSSNQIFILVNDYESEEADSNKLIQSIGITVNLAGKVSGNITNTAAFSLYYNNSGTLTQSTTAAGVVISTYQVANEKLTLNAQYNASYGVTNATIKSRLYVLEIPE